MPDETRVFDVTRPSHVNPTPTSRPVIVGHHPEASDPMVKDDSGFLGTEKTGELSPTKISFTDASADGEELPGVPIEPGSAETPEVKVPTVNPPAETPDSVADANDSPAVFSSPGETSETNLPESANDPSLTSSASEFEPAADTGQPELNHTSTSPSDPQPSTVRSQPHIEQLHFNEPKPKRSWVKLLALVLAILIGLYLAIDAGVFGSSINLPFHVFKQKPATNNTPVSTPTNNSNQQTSSNTPSVPIGFKEYKLAGTSLTFAAPAAWGNPTSTAENGYTKRGGTNQPDGSYAYTVDFATNKDVQVVVTSGKYLPPARASTYYDFLQWCTGTNDGKIYKSILHYSTTNKVDTPTTTTCDQGPLSDAQKLNSSTIVQLKTQDAAGKVLGDLYTKNLDDSNLVVFRVKDAAMTNSNYIKQLLDTVKITATANSTNSQ